MTVKVGDKTKTRVVHLRREPHEVYIGRGSKWGNPFSHMPSQFNVIPVATREEAIKKVFRYPICLSCGTVIKSTIEYLLHRCPEE